MVSIEHRTAVVVQQIKQDIAALKMLSEGIEQQKVSRDVLQERLSQIDTHLKELYTMLGH